ncbi:GNAT family N-acetyltransferase [Glaciimonas soli]|uniref:GNAT family N-acetyltransferase n=1 Tax=Glaciimonas soli TaxID=2590999 RepID=A0A843YYB7_9BURK|nr:GNAT family N-acetyltransferase [Glaciimonas soli]MQR01526.1 GNAT family N-acetyltransferase [Glaciimonas soli]
MQEIHIRHSEAEDIEAIKDIYACPKAMAGTLQLPFPTLKKWQKQLSELPVGVYSLVAVIDNIIVGQLGLEANQRPRRKHVASFGIAVKDAYQGQGVGSKLLAAAIDLADNWLNITRIELTVFTDNAAAIATYKKHGFIIEGESAQYAFRNGEFVSVYHMARLR